MVRQSRVTAEVSSQVSGRVLIGARLLAHPIFSTLVEGRNDRGKAATEAVVFTTLSNVASR